MSEQFVFGGQAETYLYLISSSSVFVFGSPKAGLSPSGMATLCIRASPLPYLLLKPPSPLLGGTTSKKLRFFGDHLVHHFLALLGKLRAKQQVCRIFEGLSSPEIGRRDIFMSPITSLSGGVTCRHHTHKSVAV